MKCKKCGTHLKGGKLYCSNCGHVAQMVPDYSLLEEEMLQELLIDTDVGHIRKETITPDLVFTKTKHLTIKKKKKLLLIIGIILTFVVTSTSFILWLVHREHEHSYPYQYEKGLTFFKEKNYEKAITFFKKALKLDDSQISVRMKMADTYLAMKDNKRAATMLQEITGIDQTNQDAYKKLIKIYLDAADYPSLLSLKESVSEAKVLPLFQKFEAKKPQFSIIPGSYSNYIDIAVKGNRKDEIYYTIDGSSPKEKGQLYHQAIPLHQQSELLIRAIARSKYGFYSEELAGKYIVTLNKPTVPDVSPKSGTFKDRVSISIRVPEGCTVYYTWGNQEPTTQSTKYTEAITVPNSGENILSLFLVDSFGMHSDIIKYSYKYLPQPNVETPPPQDKIENLVIQEGA
jgi:tetratricopeptide (TPR) repeat protein